MDGSWKSGLVISVDVGSDMEYRSEVVLLANNFMPGELVSKLMVFRGVNIEEGNFSFLSDDDSLFLTQTVNRASTDDSSSPRTSGKTDNIQISTPPAISKKSKVHFASMSKKELTANQMMSKMMD